MLLVVLAVELARSLVMVVFDEIGSDVVEGVYCC